MSIPAISVRNIGKQYQLGARQKSNRTFREALSESVTAPFRRAYQTLRRNKGHTTAKWLWALKDISLDVEEGEVLGLIGRNGAGKSTLLKILASITEPTQGYAEIYGRVGALLEVGTGFHQELTGRENIYLNAAILGMRRKEIDRKFDEIVAFAGVDEFIDTAVKHYSTGMGLRLGFAVAAYLEPEILIVDEVLAVGDASFQQKCLAKMGDVAHGGRTVLFVSHNLGAIESLCQRTVWLDGGQIHEVGESSTVIANYMKAVANNGLITKGDSPFQVSKVELRNGQGETTSVFSPGEDIIVQVSYSTTEPYSSPYFWIGIYSQQGGVTHANMLFDGRRPSVISGDGVIGCRFKELPLLPNSYILRMGVRAKDGKSILFEAQEIAAFNVVGKLSEVGLMGEQADILARSAIPMIYPYEWYFPDGTIIPVRITPRKVEALNHTI